MPALKYKRPWAFKPRRQIPRLIDQPTPLFETFARTGPILIDFRHFNPTLNSLNEVRLKQHDRN